MRIQHGRQRAQNHGRWQQQHGSRGQIAENTGGAYFRVADRDELVNAYNEIATTAQTKIPIRISMPLLIAALVLLFVGWLMINTRYGTIP